ncbi:MAG: hypothetical protein NT031_09675, partial [Planctomycetota bacterium]|nr:hypothetical protein [Planctomycetota bacterium]
QTASLAPEASLTDRLTEITPPAPATPEPENPKAKALLAQARELCRQGEYARAADCLDEAAGQVDGYREVRAQASLLRDFAAIRENARLAKQGDANLRASYQGIPWDKTLLPSGPTDAIPLAGEDQPPRALVFPDIPSIDSDDDKAAKAKLRTPVTLEFADKELGAVIEQISQATGVNIRVKWRALEAAEITSRTPLLLKLKNFPAEKALTILLGDLSVGEKKLVHEVEDGVVVISTQADLNNRPLLTRAYDMADLLEEDTRSLGVPRRASPPPPPSFNNGGLFGSTSDMGGAAAGGAGFVGPRIDLARLGNNTASSGGSGFSGDSSGSAASGAGGVVSVPGPAAWRVGN